MKECLGEMAHVVLQQLEHIAFKKDSHYAPVKRGKVEYIIMLIDRNPEEEEDLIQPRVLTTNATTRAEDEPSKYPFED
ncbi:Putative 26S proteasome regulatory subunit N2 [Rhizopus microsporus]|nr:Putative 26S proteasome regulatory subunit N2 [Rhizopus microsporus]